MTSGLIGNDPRKRWMPSLLRPIVESRDHECTQWAKSRAEKT
jgi:hypothetical protein